jgi:Outer membrane protein beta-barrel domain
LSPFCTSPPAAVLIASIGLLASGIAAADDPFGLYIGGAVGRATLRTGDLNLDSVLRTAPAAISEHDTGWKASIGVRPISFVGAELEYIDFGHGRGSIPGSYFVSDAHGDLHAHAEALFGVVYLPQPIPRLDFYTKAGVARYTTKENFSSEVYCADPLDCAPGELTYGIERNETRFAYGVGAQVKLAAFAVRAEYERIAANGADPDILSLGLTWSF